MQSFCRKTETTTTNTIISELTLSSIVINNPVLFADDTSVLQCGEDFYLDPPPVTTSAHHHVAPFPPDSAPWPHHWLAAQHWAWSLRDGHCPLSPPFPVHHRSRLGPSTSHHQRERRGQNFSHLLRLPNVFVNMCRALPTDNRSPTVRRSNHSSKLLHHSLRS